MIRFKCAPNSPGIALAARILKLGNLINALSRYKMCRTTSTRIGTSDRKSVKRNERNLST